MVEKDHYDELYSAWIDLRNELFKMLKIPQIVRWMNRTNIQIINWLKIKRSK